MNPGNDPSTPADTTLALRSHRRRPPDQLAHTKRLYVLAEDKARRTVESIGEAVATAHAAGRALLELRGVYGFPGWGGDRRSGSRRQPAADLNGEGVPWERFLEGSGMNPRTCRAYMRLAQRPLSDLGVCGSIREALRLVGVLEDGPAAQPAPASEGQPAPRPDALHRRLASIGRMIEKRTSDPSTWPDRAELRLLLSPIAEVYRRLVKCADKQDNGKHEKKA